MLCSYWHQVGVQGEQSDQNEEATGIVLQDNEDESAAVIDGESTAPVKDHNATLSFLDRQ